MTKEVTLLAYANYVRSKEVYFLQQAIDCMSRMEQYLEPDFNPMLHPHALADGIFGQPPEFQLLCFLYSELRRLSDYIHKISWQANGIKDSNISIPWEDLAQLGRLIEKYIQEKPTAASIAVIKKLAGDFSELKKRLHQIYIKEHLHFFNSPTDGLEFPIEASTVDIWDMRDDSKHETKQEPWYKSSGIIKQACHPDNKGKAPIKLDEKPGQAIAGLTAIRSFTEPLLDSERVAKIIHLLAKLDTVDVTTHEGKQALMMVAQSVGEISGWISLTTKKRFDANSSIPWKKLKELRNLIKSAVDSESCFAELNRLFKSTASADVSLLQNLKQSFMDLKPRFELVSQQLDKSSNQSSWTPENPRFVIDGNVDDKKFFDEFLQKIKMKEKYANEYVVLCNLLEGEFPCPQSNKEYEVLLGRKSTINRAIVESLNSYRQSHPSEKPLLGKMEGQFWPALGRLFTISTTPATNSVEVASPGLSDFCSHLTGLRKPPRDDISRNCNKNLMLILASITEIANQLSKLKSLTAPQLRLEIDGNPNLDLSFKYLFTVIGQAIRNLEWLDEFNKTASPFFRREFNTLKWLRNNLMHEMDSPMGASLLMWYSDSIAPHPLSMHVSSAHISVYLDNLKTNIQTLLSAIAVPPAKSRLPDYLYERVLDELLFAYETDTKFLLQNLVSFIELPIKPPEKEKRKKKIFRQHNGHLEYEGEVDDSSDEEILPEAQAARDLQERTQRAVAEHLRKHNKLSSRKVTLSDLEKNATRVTDLVSKSNSEIIGLRGRIVDDADYIHLQQDVVFVVGNSQIKNAPGKIKSIAELKEGLAGLLGTNFILVSLDELTKDLSEEKDEKNSAHSNLNAFLQKTRAISFEAAVNTQRLFSAVEQRDVAGVKQILNTQVYVINLRVKGYSALHSACMENAKGTHVGRHLEIATLLLQKGANPNQFDKHGRAPLHYAAIEENHELLELMLEHKAEPGLADKHGDLPVELAITHEVDPSIQRRLLSVSNLTPQEKLVQAILMDDINLVSELIASGTVDINQSNKKGLYPVHAACRRGNMQLVQLLQIHNANFHQLDADGNSVLHIACYVDYKVNITLIRFLLEQVGIDPNIQNKGGDTALHNATDCDDKDIIYLLIQYKANPNLKDSLALTPLLSLLNGYTPAIKIVEALVRGGSDLTIQSERVGNALHHAAELSHTEAARVFLRYGADLMINSQGSDFEGKTAYQIAKEKGYDDFAALLQPKNAAIPNTPSTKKSSKGEQKSEHNPASFWSTPKTQAPPNTPSAEQHPQNQSPESYTIEVFHV